MDFESIEGLTENEILNLYDDVEFESIIVAGMEGRGPGYCSWVNVSTTSSGRCNADLTCTCDFYGGSRSTSYRAREADCSTLFGYRMWSADCR